MIQKEACGLVGAVLFSLVGMAACGGSVDLESTTGGKRAFDEGEAGSGIGVGGTKSGTGGSDSGTGDDENVVGTGGSGIATGGSGIATGGSGIATGGSGIATGGSGVGTGGSGIATGGAGPVEEGWRWNVECRSAVDDYCALDGAVCAQSWSEGKSIDSWCSHSNVTDVAVYNECNGYHVVSIFGVDETGGPPDMFNTYYFDLETGGLVHIDSNHVPSYTQCVAGDSGDKFDVFGCTSGLATCR